MRITVDLWGLDRAQRGLVDRFSPRRLNAAAATALTRTAVDVRDAERQEVRRVFDRPTPYTQNSLYLRPATAQRLEAEVYFKDDAGRGGIAATTYLLPQVEGGNRSHKRVERLLQMAGHLPQGWYATAGQGARLDAYGNVSRGQIIQVLSQLRISAVSGFTRNMPFDGRKQIAAQRRAGGRFFVVKPGGKIQPGIYQRELTGRNISPVFIFVRSASYQPRLDFHGLAKRVAAERLPVHLQRSIEEHAARLAGAGR